jgi:hypothetical protein
MPAANRRDVAPWMEAAGRTFAAEKSIFDDKAEREAPRTPERIRRFRKSFSAQVGVGAVHFGIANDTRHDACAKKNIGSGPSAMECLTEPCANGVASIVNDVAERNYVSRKREPLGCSAVSHTALPEATRRPTFAFGVGSKTSENAKGVIYGGAEDRGKNTVGIPVTRNYDWARVNIDPTRFRFGSLPAGESAVSAKQLVEVECSKPTKLVPLIVEQTAAVAGTTLGKTRNMGFGQEGVELAFKPVKQDGFGARALLSSCGTMLCNDAALGRPVCKSSTLRRLRAADNASRPVADRAFGCPTIRTDLTKPASRKVTNVNNYGDDANAGTLLYPSAYTASGVSDATFENKMSRAELGAMNERAHLELTEKELDRAFAHAAAKEGGGDKVTISAFRVAIHDLEL